MIEILERVAVAFGGTAAAVGVLALLARSLLRHWLDKDVDRYRLKLDAELRQQALEHEVRFRRVDQKVAQALGDTYVLLQDHLADLKYYVQPFDDDTDPSRDERQKKAEASLQALRDHLVRARLYLPPDLYDDTRGLAGELRKIIRDFGIGLMADRHWQIVDDTKKLVPDIPVPREREDKIDYFAQTYEAMDRVASELVERLVTRFQKTLGVVQVESSGDGEGRDSRA